MIIPISIIENSIYSGDIYNYLKSHSRDFYKSVIDFYYCYNAYNNSDINLIQTLYILSKQSQLNSNVFINMILLIDYDQSLESRLQQYNIELYSGSIIISALLPADLIFQDGSITIMGGILVKGNLTKFVINKLLDLLTHVYGIETTRYFEAHIACLSKIFLSSVKNKIGLSG